jgi:hypothetical protein
MLLQPNAYDDRDTNVAGSKVGETEERVPSWEEAIAMVAAQHRAKSSATLKDQDQVMIPG